MTVLLNDEAIKFLQLRRLPGRLTILQTAALLGFEPACITVLVARKLLKPLGKPTPNSIKYFAACKIEQLRAEEDWLSKATQAMAEHWKDRNVRLGNQRLINKKER